MKIKLTKVYRSYKDKNGNEFKGRDGRPYEKLAVQCNEYGSTWLSGFGSKATTNWREGDYVDVTVNKNMYQGKEYLNFRALSKLDMMQAQMDLLAKRVLILESNSMPNTKQLAPAIPAGDFFGNPIIVEEPVSYTNTQEVVEQQQTNEEEVPF